MHFVLLRVFSILFHILILFILQALLIRSHCFSFIFLIIIILFNFDLLTFFQFLFFIFTYLEYFKFKIEKKNVKICMPSCLGYRWHFFAIKCLNNSIIILFYILIYLRKIFFYYFWILLILIYIFEILKYYTISVMRMYNFLCFVFRILINHFFEKKIGLDRFNKI
jgi:hypothetical protein